MEQVFVHPHGKYGFFDRGLGYLWRMTSLLLLMLLLFWYSRYHCIHFSVFVSLLLLVMEDSSRTPDVDNFFASSGSVKGSNDGDDKIITMSLMIPICEVGLSFPTGRSDPSTVALGAFSGLCCCCVVCMSCLWFPVCSPLCLSALLLHCHSAHYVAAL